MLQTNKQDPILFRRAHQIHKSVIFIMSRISFMASDKRDLEQDKVWIIITDDSADELRGNKRYSTLTSLGGKLWRSWLTILCQRNCFPFISMFFSSFGIEIFKAELYTKRFVQMCISVNRWSIEMNNAKNDNKKQENEYRTICMQSDVGLSFDNLNNVIQFWTC